MNIKGFLIFTIVITVIGFAASLILGQWMNATWQFLTLIWVKSYMNLYGKYEERSDLLYQSMQALKKISEAVEKHGDKQQTQTN